RSAAAAVFVAVLGAVVFGTLLVLGPAIDVDLPVDRLLAACVSVTLIALVYGAVALAVGAATGRRAPALGAAAVLAVVGYLGNTFARQVAELEWLRFGSAFHYAMDPDPLLHGFDLGRTALPLAVPVVLAALGAFAFTRRAVGVCPVRRGADGPRRAGAGPLQDRVDERLRVEGREVVGALAEPDEFDRHAEFPLHLDDDAALGGAVHLGQHDPGDVDDLGEHPGLPQAV